MAVEAPVHENVIAERVRSHVRFGSTSGLRSAIRSAIQQRLRAGTIRQDLAQPEFFYPASFDEVKPRRPSAGGARRRLKFIADAEIEAGVLRIARAGYGCVRDELVAETARHFGNRRTGHRIAGRIGNVVDSLERDGRLRAESGKLVAQEAVVKTVIAGMEWPVVGATGSDPRKLLRRKPAAWRPPEGP